MFSFFKKTCTAPFPPPTAIPQETLHLLPLCSRSPSPCAFSSTSPFVCALVCCALFYQPIRLFRRGKLGAGINQRRHTQEAGTLAHAARLMMERIKKKVRSGKESMPPLPGQTLHLSTSPGGQKKREVFSILPPCCLRWLVFECERQLCESHTAHQKSEAVVVESQKASFMLLPL